MTTLDRIFLSEVTTAAQVSSAEDSIARTVKERDGRVQVLAIRLKARAESMSVLNQAQDPHGQILGAMSRRSLMPRRRRRVGQRRRCLNAHS